MNGILIVRLRIGEIITALVVMCCLDAIFINASSRSIIPLTLKMHLHASIIGPVMLTCFQATLSSCCCFSKCCVSAIEVSE